MADPFATPARKRKRTPILRRFDAWMDSSLFGWRARLGDAWERLAIRSRRLKATGPWRWAFELAGEGFTLGVAGTIVMLAFAVPAFKLARGDDWRTQDEFSITFLDRYGQEIGQRGIIHRDSVPVDELPDHLVKAVLSTEDRRFYDHYGIDPVGILRALITNAKAGGVAQGGSTLTQQLAKNLFLSNERSLERKIKEAYLALWLEARLSKNEILRLYLDRAFMGGGTHGVAAAAEFYFGKPVKEVTLAEAAMLAGLFKAPSKYAPHVNLPAARARANEVLSNLVEAGFMSEGQVSRARREPADVIDRETVESPDYFLDYAFNELRDHVRENDLPGRSFVVRTTFDRGLQSASEDAVADHLRQFGDEFDVEQAALVMMSWDGAVRAIVGGRDYGESQYNRATSALRQPGSAFKTFVYALAMESGYRPESVIRDEPITINGWSPRNYGRSFAGRVTLMTALARSINTVPVRLARDLGYGNVVDLAHKMGVESDLRADKTLALGTSVVTVMDMTTAYATLANGGYESGRHAFTQIIGHDGRVLYDRRRDAARPDRIMQPLAAESMNQILSQIPQWGTARRAQLKRAVPAGKTGTTQSYRDAWFVGYTGDFVAGVWFGNDDYTPTNDLTGGRLPAMTWARIMEAAHASIDEPRIIPGLEPFAPPPREADDAEVLVEVGPIQRGLTPAGSATLGLIAEAFRGAPPLRLDGDGDAPAPPPGTEPTEPSGTLAARLEGTRALAVERSAADAAPENATPANGAPAR